LLYFFFGVFMAKHTLGLTIVLAGVQKPMYILDACLYPGIFSPGNFCQTEYHVVLHIG
jgi:hypothetical protein